MATETGLPGNGQQTAVPRGISRIPVAFYISFWIISSGSAILFNKYILDTVGFRITKLPCVSLSLGFPIFLTTCHLLFATVVTQTLARTTGLLDDRETMPMDGHTYRSTIVPIAVLFTLSLICGNHAYLYLSVAFIQMLKTTTVVPILLATWLLQSGKPNMAVLGSAAIVVLGTTIASYTDIDFNPIGFGFQLCGIVFEGIRLVMVQMLLSSEHRMGPLVLLYHLAPISLVMSAVCCMIFESELGVQDILDAGVITLFINAALALSVNVVALLLIEKTSSLVRTLAGVFKSVLVVGSSLVIWSTPLPVLQIIGYTIALGGLFCYEIGIVGIEATIEKCSFPISRLLSRTKHQLLAVGLSVVIVLGYIYMHMQYPIHRTVGMVEHPIEELIRTSRAQFEKTLAKQSRTLHEAVNEYRARYGMYPPPKFDMWYEFARSKNVQLIDEFDTINDLLRPFWGVPPAIIRQRVRDAVGQEGHPFSMLTVRNGQMSRPVFGWEKVQTREYYKSEIIMDMAREFVHHLPDMDIIFNKWDEPALVIPHNLLDNAVKMGQKHRQRGRPHNFFSERPSDLVDVIPSCYGTAIIPLGKLTPWEYIVQSCPADSPARQINGLDQTTAYARGPLSFIYNTTAFSDVCKQPSLQFHHGFFDRPIILNLISTVLPVFSPAKPSSFNDLLYPSPVIYSGDMNNLDEKSDMDWELKLNQLHWRGSTTSGFATLDGWRRHHRQRFVAGMDNITEPVKILKKVDDVWVESFMAPDAARPMFDVKFTGSIADYLGRPDAIEQEKNEFDFAPREGKNELWKWKYLLDIDGKGLSGRFYYVMKSKSLVFRCALMREWHNDRILPWVHYIPLGLNGTDWYETVRFFIEEERGQILGKQMGYGSGVWAKSVLRKEDFEVW